MDEPETWRWIWLVTTAVLAIGEMASAGTFFLAPFAVGAGVEVSISAPGGVPQVSVGGGGQVAVGGQFDVYGTYDDIDVTTDADAGTMDAEIESVDASASGYGGVQAGAEFGVDFSASPVDGGIPGIGVSGEVGFETQSGLDLDGGYSTFDLHSEPGYDTGW